MPGSSRLFKMQQHQVLTLNGGLPIQRTHFKSFRPFEITLFSHSTLNRLLNFRFLATTAVIRILQLQAFSRLWEGSCKDLEPYENLPNVLEYGISISCDLLHETCSSFYIDGVIIDILSTYFIFLHFISFSFLRNTSCESFSLPMRG